MDNSILSTIKKILGLDASYTPFDTDIIVFINGAFLSLQQVGVGPESGFSIHGYDETWASYLTNPQNLEAVKTYIYLHVKRLFDPPSSSFVMDAYNKQMDELIWRLNVQAESGVEA